MKNNIFFIALTLLATPIAYGMQKNIDVTINDLRRKVKSFRAKRMEVVDAQVDAYHCEQIMELLNRQYAVWVEGHKEGEPFPSKSLSLEKVKDVFRGPSCILFQKPEMGKQHPSEMYYLRHLLAMEKCRKNRKLSPQELLLLLKIKSDTEKELQNRNLNRNLNEMNMKYIVKHIESPVKVSLWIDELFTALEMPTEFSEYYEIDEAHIKVVSKAKS